MSLSNLTIQPGFWEVGAYKTNVKRIKDGMDQLDEFTKMVKERMELEKNYGKNLQSWHQKWITYVDKQIQPGTIKQSWNNMLDESRELAKIHLTMKDRFNDEVMKTINLYKKENHHTTAFRGSKEIREIDDAFEKAQRQWKKLYEKVESAKKTYFHACRAEKSAYVQMVNVNGDTSVSQDGSDKIRDRHQKCLEEVKKTRSFYEAQLKDISQYNSVYMENMAFVFEKCQQLELKRMKFVMEMMSGTQKILVDLVSPTKLSQMHRNLENHFRTVSEPEYQADLKEWSQNYGIDSPMNWPTFEDYTPEMRNISSMKKSKEISGVVLTKKTITNDELGTPPMNGHGKSRPLSTVSSLNNHNDYGYTRHDLQRAASSNSSQENETIGFGKSSSKPTSSINSDSIPASKSFSNPDPFKDPFSPTKNRNRSYNGSAYTETSNHNYHHNNNGTNIYKNGNHYQEDRGQENIMEEEDNAKYGDDFGFCGPAKALYDYSPIESDELSLSKGDILEVISGPDSLGWCLGKKNGETGLFPASYVSQISSV